MKKQGIYCIEHVESGKRYIGSSMNISRRFTRHRYQLKYNKHHCVYLQRAVNKYGLSEFKFYVVEETNFQSKEQLQALEQKYLDSNANLYNIGSVGGGDNLSSHPNKDAIIERITETVNANIAKMTTEERIEKWGRSGELNGRWKDGRCTKMLCPVCEINEKSSGSKTCKSCVTYDRCGKKNSFYGKSHSEETLKILRSKPSPNKGAEPEDQSYTKQYEITYPDGSSKIVYGMKIIANEFKSSIANVDYTIDRMKRNSLPTKRSRFYQHFIREV